MARTDIAMNPSFVICRIIDDYIIRDCTNIPISLIVC
jgi:hypothetical protein